MKIRKPQRALAGLVLLIVQLMTLTAWAGSSWSGALVLRQAINLKGNSLFSDSYDSTDPAKSTAGKYDSSKYSGDLGNLMPVGGVTNSVGAGNVLIYGTLHTGPGAPVYLGPYGGIGPHGSQVSDIPTAESLGYIAADANVTFPSIALPADYAYYLSPAGGTVITWSSSITASATNSTVPPSPLPVGGVTTNESFSYQTTYPNPPPAGITTNVTDVTVTNYPAPPPAGLVTNVNNVVGSSTLPSPLPDNVTTNYTTQLTTSTNYPAPDAYVGTVTTNYQGHTGQIASYTYNSITSRSYTYTAYTYTYPSCIYGVPYYTYTYELYQTNRVYSTNSYDYVLNANNKYTAASLNGTVCVTGPNVDLVLPNGLSGAENFTFNADATVRLYCGGSSCVINGNQFQNPIPEPANFMVYCTASVTSLTLNSSGSFAGFVVAPSADIILNGPGNINEDICGALMGKSCTLYGHFSFHYDESLSGSMPVPAQVTTPTPLGDGSFQLMIGGDPSHRCLLEASSNLRDWVPLVTNAPPFTFTDGDAVNFPARFYRVSYQP